MANDREHKASSPWGRDNGSKVKHRRQGCLLPSSASAQDLRCLDMEKEKEDVSSPRGVLEACMRGFESDSFSFKNSTAEVESRSNSSWSRFFKLWKKQSIKRLASFPPLAVPKVPKRKSSSTRENPQLSHLYNINSSLVNFSLSDLLTATDNFSQENIIGKGGYADVYKGRLEDGQLIAVKRLTKGTADERTSSFLSEIGIIAHVDHPNTAKLIGCGIEGGMHLIFQLSPLGSLGSLLHGSKDNKLDWRKRYKIALGTADGLLYLHENCQRRIIHRDIKADNILLTEDFEPQICDFGLAKWLPQQWTHHSVAKFEGTFGYFAPEYFMHGTVDEKTDVFSFGVLLLELITGRRALDHLQQSLVIWAKPLLDGNDIEELVDPSLCDDYDIGELDRMVLTASMCIEQSPILRPRMNQVVIMLRGDEFVSDCSVECQRKSLRRTFSEELLDALEYNSTKYFHDLKRHEQVALGS
ncbi:Receptor-like cytosolic serine/threonine-protein kinase RBK2 [Morella rubra]|uniref:non-specific serine/threonine protein kinase n=1 Tax=Morella rubra TaxID=262757 RepID=A0A6A1UR85_9ROSI|nr:Receptor-like cytosolic serine/threonine-protein kinase RBK2 [Morella rubra]